ncbi:MAG: hypothetical protein RIS82_1009 [Actinomycetota bacterium]|jgi:dephospho-CoA kinase
MYLVGLTGGIAAGKSTVADYWARHGGVEIDADQLAREAVAPGSAGALAVLQEFGESVFDAEGNLDRKALGTLVFENAEARAKLENIIHPIVRSMAQQKLAEQSPDAIVIYNVPLLVEAAVYLPFDLVVTVEAPLEKQVDRLVKLRGMAKADAEARIAAQATPAQRANAADVILNSNQDLILLLKDAESLWARIQREAQAKFSA